MPVETEGTETVVIDDVPLMLQLSFVFISFGYMLPWTALGSLISYYKYTYGAGFYVKIYCAYYLPGLPIALLQYRYDEYLDSQFGSRNTYMFRGVFAFSANALILFSMLWFDRQSQLVWLFALLGVSSWMCHGTASMMASMYPRAVIAYLQIGFRCPEIYIISANSFLNLGKDASIANLMVFYKVTALVVLVGLICWILVAGSNTSLAYFADKDFRMQADDYSESEPLIGKSRSISLAPAVPADIHSPVTFDEDEDWRSSLDRSAAISKDNSKQRSGGGLFSLGGRVRSLVSGTSRPPQLHPQGHVEMMADMAPVCGALIITIWGSIFQAAFFAYVESPRGRNIEQILYFTRLVADLLGRPLTFLPRPAYLQVSERSDIETISAEHNQFYLFRCACSDGRAPAGGLGGAGALPRGLFRLHLRARRAQVSYSCSVVITCFSTVFADQERRLHHRRDPRRNWYRRDDRRDRAKQTDDDVFRHALHEDHDLRVRGAVLGAVRLLHGADLRVRRQGRGQQRLPRARHQYTQHELSGEQSVFFNYVRFLVKVLLCLFVSAQFAAFMAVVMSVAISATGWLP